MSLVHLKKSVMTLHLREIVEDGTSSNKTALMGLGALLLGPLVLPAVAKAGRPVIKAVIKGGLSLYQQGETTVAEVTEKVTDKKAESQEVNN